MRYINRHYLSIYLKTRKAEVVGGRS